MAQENKTDLPLSKNRLYVKWNLDDAGLKTVFEQFGTVTDAHVVRGVRQRSDYGFITFESEDAAAKAMASLQGKSISTPLSIEYSQSEKPRERKPRAPRADKKAGGDNENKSNNGDSAPRVRQERVKKDYSQVKAIQLTPDPVQTAPPAGSKLEELKCAGDDRLFRSGRQESQKGDFITSLAFKPKQGAGGLNASINFKLSADQSISLKVVSVVVKTRDGGDTRVTATVAHPSSGRFADVYLRHFVDEDGSHQVRHKFFELRETDLNPELYKDVDESKIDPNTKIDCFFVALDKIVLDRTSGLWTELVISLYRTKVLRRAPRIEGAAGGAAGSSSSSQGGAAKNGDRNGERTGAPRRRRGPRGGGGGARGGAPGGAPAAGGAGGAKN